MSDVTYTNITEASRNGNIEILKKLSRKEANTFDGDGMTPVHWASSCGKSDALIILVRRGGDPEKPNSEGCTATHLAASGGHLDCLVFLTNLGCNVYAVNDNGQTPIQQAVKNGQLECVRHIEALVTHQLSQSTLNVEKMQFTAAKEAERRLKEKNKLILKLDRALGKSAIKTRKLMGLPIGAKFASCSSDEYVTNERRPLSDDTNYELESQLSSTDNESDPHMLHEGGICYASSSTSDNSRRNHNMHKSKKGYKIGKPSKMLNRDTPHLSRSESLVTSLQSLHSSDSFITSGSFTNINLQGGISNSLKNGGNLLTPTYHEQKGNIDFPNYIHQPVKIQSIVNVIPSQQMEPLYTLLHSLQLDEFREVFIREKIDLRACLLCDESDLREIGLPVGPRKKLLEALCKRSYLMICNTDMVDSAV